MTQTTSPPHHASCHCHTCFYHAFASTRTRNDLVSQFRNPVQHDLLDDDLLFPIELPTQLPKRYRPRIVESPNTMQHQQSAFESLKQRVFGRNDSSSSHSKQSSTQPPMEQHTQLRSNTFKDQVIPVAAPPTASRYHYLSPTVTTQPSTNHHSLTITPVTMTTNSPSTSTYGLSTSTGSTARAAKLAASRRVEQSIASKFSYVSDDEEDDGPVLIEYDNNASTQHSQQYEKDAAAGTDDDSIFEMEL